MKNIKQNCMVLIIDKDDNHFGDIGIVQEILKNDVILVQFPDSGNYSSVYTIDQVRVV